MNVKWIYLFAAAFSNRIAFTLVLKEFPSISTGWVMPPESVSLAASLQQSVAFDFNRHRISMESYCFRISKCVFLYLRHSFFLLNTLYTVDANSFEDKVFNVLL